MTTASQVQYRYNMIEDYALAEWPPLAQDVEEAFLALQPPPADGAPPPTELLTVSHDQSLMHFTRDPSSSSGWAQEQRIVAATSTPHGHVAKALISSTGSKGTPCGFE